MIASVLEYLKILSELIAESKCSPLARIEKQAICHKKLDLLKTVFKITEAAH